MERLIHPMDCGDLGPNKVYQVQILNESLHAGVSAKVSTFVYRNWNYVGSTPIASAATFT
jgi:hypothetical protein